MNEKKSQILDANLRFYGFPMAEFMEEAGKGIAEKTIKHFGSNKKILVVCGTGNNGGDGFVGTRYLSKKNKVELLLLGKPSEIKHPEAITAWKKIPKTVKKVNLIGNKYDVIVDAMLGSGVQGKVREPFASTVKELNKLTAKKISIDLPTPEFKADVIVSLHLQKHPDAEVIDIGIPHEAELIAGPGNIKFLNKPFKKSHKGENGCVLIVAGGKKYHGAAFFAGKAASRSSDLVYFATSRENIPILKKDSSSFIVSQFSDSLNFAKKSDSILLGPGLDESNRSKSIVHKILRKFPEKKTILDATALRLVNKKFIHKNCLLTPHAEEFRDLFGFTATPEHAKQAAKAFKCIIVLKGAVDAITDGVNIYKNFTGNEGMTKGGTGDVLAGLITGLASTNSLLDSALAGVFANGLAGDLLYCEKGTNYDAEDLLEILPHAIHSCEEI